jgi:hypothetical protein
MLAGAGVHEIGLILAIAARGPRDAEPTVLVRRSIAPQGASTGYES